MSLLNDALKAAEQRQNRPQISSAYTGQAQARPPRRSKAPLLVVLLALVLVAGGAAWWFMMQPAVEMAEQSRATEQPPEPVPAKPVKEPGVAKAAPEPEPVQPVSELVRPNPEPEPEPEPAAESEPPATNPKPQPPEQTPAEPEPEAQVAKTAPGSAEPEEPKPEEAKPEAQATDSASVKKPRETPQAIDRRTSRELGSLLARGRTTEAEQRLVTLTENQPAPESREVFARQMLVQQMPGRALEWLPQELAGEHASLRLLRARAQLEQGDLEQAVATLRSEVPPVDSHPEYRITLATLLQQAGEAEASAGHWSELIEYDNNQPSWWLGLAMALDAGGQVNSATRAYAQAATMPGLPERLANYARQRLQALQAGS